jgi:hypothetical protein
LKSGSLNLLEPPGLVHACNWIALPAYSLFLSLYGNSISNEKFTYRLEMRIIFEKNVLDMAVTYF